MSISRSTMRFVRHYLEMIAVMFLGMAVLGMPAGWAMKAVDTSWSELRADAPALMLLGMALTMTLPMVAWMRYRGHGRRASTEMSGSMLVPTFAVIVLLWGELVEDIGTLLLIEHVAMLLGMLAVMLLRPDEYSGGRHGTREPAHATA